MATPSTMLPLGTLAPAFNLPDTAGNAVSVDQFDGAPALLVAFICNHCPYVKHIQPALAALAREYQAKGVGIVAINANDATAYPDDAPEHMAASAQEHGYTFPYLHDDSQEVAKAYRAACTPDFFVFDGERKLVYRGQMDASRPRNDTPVTGENLRAALDAVLAGHTPAGDQVPSMGCNIKWKPGNAPDYFG